MSIILFHGDDLANSYQALQNTLTNYKNKAYAIQNCDGKNLDLSTAQNVGEQKDFFDTAKIVLINNLLARPKSKVRTAIIDYLQQSSTIFILYEIKKITPTTIKSLGKIEKNLFVQKEAIWYFLSKFSPNNLNIDFINYYQLSQEQFETKNKTSATVYLTVMLIWQIQQLIETKNDNYQGPPFKKNSLKQQADKFELSQLIHWHAKLIDFDYRHKAGKIKINQSEILLLLLIEII